jgi:hypothetical protein
MAEVVGEKQEETHERGILDLELVVNITAYYRNRNRLLRLTRTYA